MAVTEYDNNDIRHINRDVRDAHVNSSTARTLATLALIGAASWPGIKPTTLLATPNAP
jgi:hypothetical protein